jgi:hypothetical protein
MNSISPKDVRIWTFALSGGLLAGLIAWSLGEPLRTQFEPEKEMAKIFGVPQMATTYRTNAVAELKNATVAYAIQGAALGLMLGLAGGLSQGHVRRAVGAGLSGLVLGGLIVAGISYGLLHALGLAAQPSRGELTLGFQIHLAGWVPAGAIGGLALAWGVGRSSRVFGATVGGALGAALGTMAYEILGALAFPYSDTARLISATWGTRLMARLFVAIMAGGGAVVGVQEAPAAPSPQPS